MPHRPERTGAATAAGNAHSIFKHHVVTAAAMQSSAAPHIIRPTAQTAGPYAGVVTPLLSSIAAHAGMMNRSMLQTKSTDSADNRSTSTKHGDDCTVATLATEATSDELERREATASSALLMVSTQGSKQDVSSLGQTGDKDSSMENQEISTMPLKKRKKHLDFLRKNQEIETDSAKHHDPCHVSPMSHDSIGKEEVTPDRPCRTSVPNRTSSFDSKESPVRAMSKNSTQTLLDSSKIVSTTDIAPPSHVVAPHFPSVLHQVLSSQEFGSSVLQWLPDGEAWKVVRWDALRRQVLPKYFPDLRDEHGRGCGTIDAFLWHLTAWGFEELKDGTDVGAYRHDLFIRGAQKLCSKMRCTAVPSDEDSKSAGPNTVSPGRVRMGGDRTMLQVPSLNAASRIDSPSKRARYAEPGNMDGLRRSSPGPLKWPMAYKAGDHYPESAPWGHYYGESVHMGMRQSIGHYQGSSYDPRMHLRNVASDSMVRHPAQYSPPQVRSGRGSLRVSSSRGPSSPGNTPSRPSFPVSNRGKSRKTPVSNGLRSSPSTMDRVSPVEKSMAAEAHRIGSSVQGVAVAISRKTKRKLPMASKPENEATVSGDTKFDV